MALMSQYHVPLDDDAPSSRRYMFRAALCWFLAAAAAATNTAADDVFPGATWETRTPAEMGMKATRLNDFTAFVGGRGCVVRDGYMVHTWGDQSLRRDIASAAKPFISHFLFVAVESGRLPGLDALALDYEPCLGDINADLGFKDRGITFRHMANMISCYGVSEKPGTAFNYNDWQVALYWDTLFLKVYGATYDNVDKTVLGPLLTDVLRFQDNPTFMAFGTGDRPGRVRISVRDFARFGLLYLRQGNWNGTQVISRKHVTLAVSSALSNDIPRTLALQAEMCPGRRTFGGGDIPDDQADHHGSYSWTWWTNGVDRDGFRSFPDAPPGTYGAFGHGPRRALWIMPELGIVVSYNNANITGGTPPGPLTNQAMKLLMEAMLPSGDCNADGVVNLFDYGAFANCVSGPDGGPLSPECACFDLDHDEDVDLVDFGMFQAGFTGS
ncbi:MAG: hypothetical protein V3W34_03885 [Phycisphaerae bacterium]